MAGQRSISDRELAIAITLSAAALAITVTSQRWGASSGAGPGDVGSTGTPSPPAIAAATAAAAPAGGMRSADAPMAVAADVTADAPRRPLAPGLPRQLLAHGCCPGAWWSADSEELRFIDRPSGAGVTAIYGVPVWPPASPTRAVDARMNLSGSARYLVQPTSDHAEIEDLETGRRWQLPTGGGRVLLSPDGARAVWWAGGGDRESLDSLVSIFGSDVEGASPKELLALWGAQVVAFHPDNRRVLVTGRPWKGEARRTLALLDTITGDVEVLATAGWIDGATLSPSGAWAAYMVSLDRDHPEANGVWIVPTAGGELRRLPVDAAYRWRDGHRLAYIPLGQGAASQSLWQLDAETGESTMLIDGAKVTLRVADNDWTISPDGHTMAFVAQDDRNVWLIDLP